MWKATDNNKENNNNYNNNNSVHKKDKQFVCVKWWTAAQITVIYIYRRSRVAVAVALH